MRPYPTRDIDEVPTVGLVDALRHRRPFVVRAFCSPNGVGEDDVRAWGDEECEVIVVPPETNVVTAAAYAESSEKKVVKMKYREVLDRIRGREVEPRTARGERYYVFGARTPSGLWSSMALPGELSFMGSSLYVTSPGVLSKAHYDLWSALLFQIVGSKRVKLFAPSDYSFLYPVYEKESGHHRRCLIDLESPDLEKYPLVRRATCYETVLRPGDVLHIPPQWWHEVETFEPSISVNGHVAMSPLQVIGGMATLSVHAVRSRYFDRTSDTIPFDVIFFPVTFVGRRLLNRVKARGSSS